MSNGLGECRHGNLDGCPECLLNALREYQQILSDPDIHHVMDEKTLTSFKLFSRKAIARTEQEINIELQARPESDDWSVDREPQYSSPRNEVSTTSQVRFQPSVVSGSAFGQQAVLRREQHSVSPPPRRSEQSVSPPPRRSENSISPNRAEQSASPPPRALVVLSEQFPGMNYRPRASWTSDEMDELRDAVSQQGFSWERIRSRHPALRKYTGTQLKDKYRSMSNKKT